MKNPISRSLIVTSLFLTSLMSTNCGGKSEQAGETHDHAKSDSTAVAYVCPMHPDVTGKEGDACSKCGMKLEATKSADSTGHSHE